MFEILTALVGETTEVVVADGNTWSALGAAAAVGGLVATIVTTALSAWLRRRNRPEPDWAISLIGHGYSSTGGPYGEQPGYALTGTISNVGDGVAHHLKIASKLGDIGFTESIGKRSTLPILKVGETTEVFFAIPIGGWSGEVTLEWTDPPTRLKKRRKFEFKAGDFMDRPGYPFVDPETGALTQRFFEDS